MTILSSESAFLEAARILFEVSCVLLAAAVVVGIVQLALHLRHRRAVARMEEAVQSSTDLLQQLAARFAASHIRVTRYGDRRYRDGRW